MAKTVLASGPYPLTKRAIDEGVLDAQLGVYALGKLSADRGSIHVLRTGRSDTDLKTRLLSYLGHNDARGCDGFMFSYVLGTARAYTLECEVWHDYDPDNNTNHPDLPEDQEVFCPIKGCAYSEEPDEEDD